LKPQEEKPSNNPSACFTNFDERFHARLSQIIPRYFAGGEESKFAGISARYEGRIKVEYQKDLMGLLEEGMLIAVKNFKQTEKETERYTLMEISRVWPEHFGLRGLSDHGYYPMQFEIIEQSEADWQTDDKATMMIQISTIPINYDLTLGAEEECKFIKGFSYPIVASQAHILNSQLINRMYNHRITEKLGIDPTKTSEDAHKDPRLGLIKMFQATKTTIPIYIDFENLVRYHFGVFAFTGGGKSNLMSNILRRLILHTKDTKVIIFDISCEYLFLLMDLFADPNIPSKVILETKTDSLEQLTNAVVKPREYETDTRIETAFKQILNQGKVSYYTKPAQKIPTYSEFLDQLDRQRSANADKPHYIEAIDRIADSIHEYIEENALSESQEINEDFVNYIGAKALETVEAYKVHDKSGLYAWATTRLTLLEVLKKKEEEEEKVVGGLTVENIRDLLEGKERLICISISDPFTIKELVIALSRDLLARRKRRFQVKPYILFVFDEAQEFIPDLSSSGGLDKDCSKHVETLLRQGRKYGLGACIATQRLAYLNTNALQQLHTYFVGTLPRPYDRSLVSETFMIDQGILEKTLEFAPGEWLLSSYIATGIENVPIFIKADNAEKEIEKHLSQTGK
jgi:DNA helicase HerA-like ATPase